MQKFVLCLIVFSLKVFLILGFPYSYNSDGYRLRRSPHRTVMVSGYYGRQFPPVQYEPEGAMAAFLTGDTVATNSYLGGKYNPTQQESEEVEKDDDRKDVQPLLPHKPIPADVPEEEDEEAPAEVSTVKPKRNSKRKPQKPKVDEEEQDESDDEGGWPFHLGRRGPAYTAFFPIVLGGHQGKSANSEAGYPGSATAIANSFSTGRGGVASSHATAYGDPYINSLLKRGFNSKRKSAAHKEDN